MIHAYDRRMTANKQHVTLSEIAHVSECDTSYVIWHNTSERSETYSTSTHPAWYCCLLLFAMISGAKWQCIPTWVNHCHFAPLRSFRAFCYSRRQCHLAILAVTHTLILQSVLTHIPILQSVLYTVPALLLSNRVLHGCDFLAARAQFRR